MQYEFGEKHVEWMKEQIWECRDDLSIYGELSDFELNHFRKELPREVKRSFEIGAGMGRGSIQLKKLYLEAEFILADRNGRTDNTGTFFPKDDEFYCDFNMTRSFCKLNGLEPEDIFDTEEDLWYKLPPVDLITSRCAIGFHVPISRYLDELISISEPHVTMIFGVNGAYVHDPECYGEYFKEHILIPGERDNRFPFQHWLVLRGLKKNG